MMENVSISDVTGHPLFQEMVKENDALRSTENLGKKNVNISKVQIPHVIKDKILMNEGTHNGVFYPWENLAQEYWQWEGIQLFNDHKDGTLTWCGEVRNARTRSEDKSIIGDLWVVKRDMAEALAFGAPFGTSATLDVDKVRRGSRFVADLPYDIQSQSLVLQPAVRQTMLNKMEELNMNNEEKLEKLKQELEEANSAYTDFVKKWLADNPGKDIKDAAEAWKKEQKQAKKKYPYPYKPEEEPDKKKKKLEEDDPKDTADPDAEDSEDKDSESVETRLKKLESENKKLQKDLEKEVLEKQSQEISKIVDSEIKLGLLEIAKRSDRIEQLKKKSSEVLEEAKENVERIKATLALDGIQEETTNPNKSTQKLKRSKEEMSLEESTLLFMQDQQGGGAMV